MEVIENVKKVTVTMIDNSMAALSQGISFTFFVEGIYADNPKELEKMVRYFVKAGTAVFINDAVMKISLQFSENKN
jgi:uncharacterized lipoprotein NlpE involved in copper resistance